MPRKTVSVFLYLFFKFYYCNYFCDTQNGFRTCQANPTTELYAQPSSDTLKCNKESGCKYNQCVLILHCVTLGEADDNKQRQTVCVSRGILRVLIVELRIATEALCFLPDAPLQFSLRVVAVHLLNFQCCLASVQMLNQTPVFKACMLNSLLTPVPLMLHVAFSKEVLQWVFPPHSNGKHKVCFCDQCLIKYLRVQTSFYFFFCTGD